jgi:hypothetical protein
MDKLKELNELLKTDPARLLQVFKDDPGLAKKILDMAEVAAAGDKVSVEGFKIFYREIYGRELPKIDNAVAEAFVEAFHNKTGVVYESWRGRGKSTFFMAWCPYVMGARPVGSTTLVRVNDSKAKEMGKAIADLITGNTGWKLIFPFIVPDERAGWSVENGFNVMDVRVTGLPGSKNFETKYGQWRMACMADHLSEKSLICSGVESGSIIGLHPTNGMWFDDLHDEQNTRSQAEMKKIIDIIEGNMKPTWFSAGGSPTLGVFCTPWSVNPPDAYQVMLRTGLFKHIKMPIFEPDENGEIFPPTGRRVKLTWPENFPMEKVEQMWHTFGTRFGQMCLCDVELSKPKNMRYQSFPAENIKWNEWPMVVGVDPVATVTGISAGDGISHFGAVQLLITPYNNIVIADGIIEKIDAAEGEQRIAEMQRTYYKTYRNASVELNGAGTMFIAMVTRTSGLKIHPHQVSEIGQGNKKDRQYRFLQPLFASGAVLVSDANTPFLTAVREYLDSFPNFDKGSYLEDVGDALAIGLLDIPQVWSKMVVNNTVIRENIYARKERTVNPWATLGEGYR